MEKEDEQFLERLKEEGASDKFLENLKDILEFAKTGEFEKLSFNKKK